MCSGRADFYAMLALHSILSSIELLVWVACVLVPSCLAPGLPAKSGSPPLFQGEDDSVSVAKRPFSSSAIASAAADRRHNSRAKASSLDCSEARRRICPPWLILKAASSRRSADSL